MMKEMSNTYSADNAAWRKKLETIVARLSDRDLARPVNHGWTVGGLLAHMAFYDCRAVVLLERWKTNAMGPSPLDIDVVNDAMKPLCNAVAPAELRRLVMEAARGVDAAIDALDPGFLARIETDGKPVRLNRALHREHHLEQIEKALGGTAS
jgi:hypothetical protein